MTDNKLKYGSKDSIIKYLNNNKIITDGAFGTYYSKVYDTRELPEKANDSFPERVEAVHREYIEAGARLIRTNTFAANTFSLEADINAVKENIKHACANAKKAVDNAKKEIAGSGNDNINNINEQIFVVADIGPIPYDNQYDKENVQKEYMEICKTFLDEGIQIFVFETFSDMDDIIPAINMLGKESFIITQFAVNQFGYSNAGLSAKRLITDACKNENVDACGFNCGVGPGHMQHIVSSVYEQFNKFITMIPNAGYPQAISGRMVFSNSNIQYFVDKVKDAALNGVDIIGGCCGTTPEYIRQMSNNIDTFQPARTLHINSEVKTEKEIINPAFYHGKEKRKLIAVELAPPFGSDDEKFMDAAHYLKDSGVDVLTFPDSPSGRTRADSILMAEKVSRETGICVMPHICCRDKNAIAIRSQLLGAHLNNIDNFLVITGDPIPSMVRSKVKSVFNFDSVGLMNIINDMNEEQFQDKPICFGGAVNQGRVNFEVELRRVKKKMEAGATFFLTQPVFSFEGAERLRRIKQETGARILCGIMPFVSLKNAMFMKNEMTGIDVTDEVLERYRSDMTKEEGEAVGINLAKEVIKMTEAFVDGYYFSFPFNRVYMLDKILK